MTVQEALQAATKQLSATGLPTPRQDAAYIVSGVIERDRTFLLTHPGFVLSAEQCRRFEDWLERRSNHYPLQYLRGFQEFYGRDFEVSPAVLIPRPETEVLVEASLERLKTVPAPVVLDVGTGSGCIAVTLACERPELNVVATDLSFDALRVARKNAFRWRCQSRCAFVQADGVAGRTSFDLIVSNPPYGSKLRPDDFERSVRQYEPEKAIFSGDTGLELYPKLFRQGVDLVAKRGWLIVEIGIGQSRQVVALARDAGWEVEEILADLGHIDRCLVFRRVD